MAYEQQIAKLKGHAIASVDELEWVIQCFELVQPAIKDRELISKFTGNKRMMGFRIFRRSVGRDCIIGITRVTYDHGPKNPTAGRLIAALTCPGADYLREKLKDDFARPIVPGEAPGRPRSELDLAASEEINKMEIAQRRQTFDEHISKLKEQWTWFSEHKGKFVDFRNTRLAHLEVSASGDPAEIASLEWDLAAEAIKRLIEIAKLLSAILGNPSRDFDQFERFAQKDGKDFLADLTV
jgi:AbiU2